MNIQITCNEVHQTKVWEFKKFDSTSLILSVILFLDDSYKLALWHLEVSYSEIIYFSSCSVKYAHH